MATLSPEVQKMLNDLGFDGNLKQATRKSDLTYFQQTHLGEDGKPLKADAKVGDKTWWALRNPSGDAQRSGLEPKIPGGLTHVRVAILEQAIAQHALGVKEVPNGFNRGPEVDKYFPSWLRKKMGKGKGEAWCAFFVNWIVTETIQRRPWGGYIGSCYALWKASKKKGLGVYTDASHVQPGDAFLMFKTDPDKARPKGGHIGLVLRVSEDGTEFNTVEGNCGNRVKVGVRKTADVSRFINFCEDGPVGASAFERGLVAAADVAAAGTR